MEVSREEVLRVAALARLPLDDDETERLTAELNDILAHVDELRAITVSDVDAIGDVADANAPPRVDAAGADPLVAEPATFATGWHDGFFTVPRVVAPGADGDDGRDGAAHDGVT